MELKFDALLKAEIKDRYKRSIFFGLVTLHLKIATGSFSPEMEFKGTLSHIYIFRLSKNLHKK